MTMIFATFGAVFFIALTVIIKLAGG